MVSYGDTAKNVLDKCRNQDKDWWCSGKDPRGNGGLLLVNEFCDPVNVSCCRFSYCTRIIYFIIPMIKMRNLQFTDLLQVRKIDDNGSQR